MCISGDMILISSRGSGVGIVSLGGVLFLHLLPEAINIVRGILPLTSPKKMVMSVIRKPQDHECCPGTPLPIPAPLLNYKTTPAPPVSYPDYNRNSLIP